MGAVSAALLLGLTAAQRPLVLSQANAGLWELSRGSGSARGSRQCLADPALLAQVEHRRASCDRTIVRNQPTNTEVHYTCPRSGFGRTRIVMITPRAFRIETQGISDGIPFNYVLQARRIGNCAAH